MSKSVGSVPVQEGVGRAKTLGGRIAAGVVAVLIFSPMVYGVSWVLFSAHFNRAFHYEKQCTIETAGVGHSRTKSYSGSSYISVKTADCGVVEFHGRLYGLRRAEVAERIDALAGQRVAVDVGYWQLPYNPMMIVGVEGLDLDR
ncbi:hypothetical protein [Rothia sp. P4278]|uniref:hypothetical protein n=1 Tax=Rothia sp. P4278 TaxID=3402658 RepID=UPI003AE538B4